MAVALKPSLSNIATDPFRNFKFRVVIHHPPRASSTPARWKARLIPIGLDWP